MSESVCSMAALVEAHRDRRLGTREIASIERHLDACAECASLSRELLVLGNWASQENSPPEDLEHRRARSRLLRVAAEVSAPDRRSRALQAALLMAALALVVGGLMFHRTHTTDKWIAATTPHQRASIVDSREVTTIEADRDAVLRRNIQGSTETVELLDGGATFKVRHLRPGERFLVTTRDARIEVRGTIFRVEVDAGTILRVSVVDGRVEVSSGNESASLSAGEQWSPAHAAKSSRPLASAAVPPRPGTVPHVANASPLAAAEEALARGDNGTAADILQSADPSDEDAAFLLLVALGRAGRDAEAANAARRYVQRFPNGFRRKEAEALANLH